MKGPYKGKFKVTQEFKGSAHDGLDLVGVDSKNIYSTVDGVVEFAGWESKLNHKKGFGKYVRIRKNDSVDRYYFGHLSSIKAKKGQKVVKGQLIGIEGNTGYSFGSHCHYCIRGYASKSYNRDVNQYSQIPNKIGSYTDNVEKKAEKNYNYYKKYSGDSVSIVSALSYLGYKSSFAYRRTIAKANGISG